MPSTVVLLSFLFLPALSEDLGKESCGRKVEPTRGVRGSSRCDQSVPGVPSISHCQRCSGISWAPTEQSEQGGVAVCLSVCPSPPSSPNALTQPELLSSLPRAPKSLHWLVATPKQSPAPCHALRPPSPPLGSRPPCPTAPPALGTFPLDHLGADGQGILRGAVRGTGGRPAPEGQAVILRGHTRLWGHRGLSRPRAVGTELPQPRSGPFPAAN